MSPATDWREIISDDESERFERHAEALRDMAKRHAGSRAPDRALHAKGNVGVRGELTVMADLPEHARFGLFATPATYPAYVRFSNGAGARQADHKPDVRGVAVKVVGAPGAKIIPGLEDKKTQDFLMIRSPATPFRDADEFVGFVLAASSPARLPGFALRLGLGRTVSIIRQIQKSFGESLHTLASTRFYSALPVKLGPYAIHYGIFPSARPEPLPARFDANHLGDELAAHLQRAAVTYDLRVQFYVDDKRTPIEDASVEWSEEVAPFLTVARLTLSKQDVSSPRGRAIAERIEGYSFDPWHATEDMRPLGNMMRARNHAYRLSTQQRGAAAEPDGSELSAEAEAT